MSTTQVATLSSTASNPVRRWPTKEVAAVGALLTLTLVPTLAGVVRLFELGFGETITSDNARFFAAPVPAVLHIVGATLFCVLGTLQFAPTFRRRFPRWHRAAGRALVPLGLIGAVGGLWMTYAYPPVENDGPALYVLRMVAGGAMFLALVGGVIALGRRDFRGHGRWMVRGYAIAMGGSTQALTHIPYFLVAELQTEAGRFAAMGAGWAINLAVAEWFIRSRGHQRRPALPGRNEPKMRAAWFSRYGGPEVLSVVDVNRPEPKRGQVRVRVVASSINAADCRLMRADPFLARFFLGLFRPKKNTLGLDVAGIVDAVGPGVRNFAVDDEVFGDTFADDLGGFAELVCISEEQLAQKPRDLSFQQAAALPLAAVTALQAVRDTARLQPGQTLCIQGAGGGVGTLLVQIAKAYGAHVTAVCGPRSVALVKSLGADRVLDYTKSEVPDGEVFDVIVGLNGYRPLSFYKRHLRPGGTYVMVGGTNRQLFDSLLMGKLAFAGSSKSCTVLTVDDSKKRGDLRELLQLVAAGDLEPVIDRAFPLEKIALAMRHAESGHVRGKVTIDVGPA